MIAGILLKRGDIISLGLYLHFAEGAYISLDEYKSSKKVVVKTIYYPSIFLILTTIIIYQAIIGQR